MRDESIRAAAADALREHEELPYRSRQFETLLDEAPLGMYLVDADFRLVQVNAAARPVFGDIPDLVGRDFEEVVGIIWPEPRQVLE